jgi:hypothetical protein
MQQASAVEQANVYLLIQAEVFSRAVTNLGICVQMTKNKSAMNPTGT